MLQFGLKLISIQAYNLICYLYINNAILQTQIVGRLAFTFNTSKMKDGKLPVLYITGCMANLFKVTQKLLYKHIFLILTLQIPPYLIVHLPRFGKDFKMYDMVFPSPELDITELLSGSMYKINNNLRAVTQ